MVQEELSLNKLIKKKNSKNSFRFFFNKKTYLDHQDYEKFQSIDFPKEDGSTKLLSGGLRYKGLFKNPIKDYPLISIIMPNFKEKNLLNALSSISIQNYENLELIVIDGNSGHETTSILKEKDDEIDIWISENDNGLWDAWNKGFKLARGDFVGIVDSSNVLYENSMNILKNYIVKNKEIDFICGTVKKGSKIYSGFRPHDIRKQFNIIPSSVVGFYIKRKSLKKVGLLNLKYKIQSDYDLIYRMIVTHNLKGIRTRSDEVFGSSGDGGFSTKHGFFKALFNEIKIRLDNNQNLFFLIYILFGRTFMKIYKSLF
tara:strand:+ start:624 stop:1565 length:942 start_codon:yes stop_codon:yes gene_type:complete